MFQDMHLHSNFSDGTNSIEEMVQCAISLGLSQISFTDHVRKTSYWIDEYFAEIQRCKKQYGKSIEIVGGIEAKLLDDSGNLDLRDDRVKSSLRIVAAMHRIPCNNGIFIHASEIKNDIGLSKKFWLKALQGIRNKKNIDCIAHPFSLLGEMGITQENYEWWSTISTIIEDVSAKIEFNVKYDNSIVPSWFWEKHKNKIVPASDSHSVKELRERIGMLRQICTKYTPSESKS